MKRTALVVLVMLAGCGSRGGPLQSAVPSDNAPEVERALAAESGSMTRRASSSDRSRLWTVHWEKARLDVTGTTMSGGELERVRGEVFQNDIVASRFTADRGLASRESDVLELSGKVIVTSVEPVGSMTCESLKWNAKDGRFEAQGNVRIVMEDYEIGPIAVLWASPDLRRVATPSMFDALK